MGKKFRIAIVILFVAILGVIIWQLFRPAEKEPIYQGKPLSFWLSGYGPYGYSSGTNTTPTPTANEADDALHHIGTNALPMLLKMLREHDTPFKDKLAELAMRQNLIRIRMRTSSGDIRLALMGLHALGPVASNAVPQLIEMYDLHPNSLSQQTVPAILGDVGPSAKAAVPLLIRSVTHTNDWVRLNSIFALGQINAEPELVVPVLIKCLNDSNPDNRASAAMSLRNFGTDAQPAVLELLKLLKDELAKSAGGSRTQGPPNWSVGNSSGVIGAGLSPADVAGSVTDALKVIEPEALAKASIKTADRQLLEQQPRHQR